MDNMNPAPGAGKVIRAPSLKRGKNDETRISDRVSVLQFIVVLSFVYTARPRMRVIVIELRVKNNFIT
jgi:hypothetical protein